MANTIKVGGSRPKPQDIKRDKSKKYGGVVEIREFNDKLKFRINPPRTKPKRFKTKINGLDELLGGGLPYGLTTFFGCAGSGKSLMARNIAKLHKTLYFSCEVLGDAPDNREHPNVTTIDYTRYLPNPHRALEELFTFIDHFNPELVVIDSITSFFSKSRKALPESDVREMASLLHIASDGELPIIGISELRGTGFNQAPAGGQGIMHGCSMLVKLNRELIRWQNQRMMYGKEFGEMVYTLQVMKDKHAVSDTFEHEVILDSQNTYSFRRVKEDATKIQQMDNRRDEDPV